MYKTFGGLKNALDREKIKVESPDLYSRGGTLRLSDGRNSSCLSLVQFPGNCGILVAYSLVGYDPNIRHKTMEYAKFLTLTQRFGFLMYSCAKDQEDIIKILTDLGFKSGKWHHNPRHKSEICVFSYDVNDLII